MTASVEQMQKIKWWHTIDLGNGITTPGVDNSPWKLRTLRMPESLRGMTVLDIGAWDGFFSFEAERRGASRVLATDSFCWSGEGWGTKAGFDYAHAALDSKVEDQEIDVLEMSPEKVGQFDLVLFLGVLYHMRHPLLALERVFSVTRRQLILETLVDMMLTRQPAMAFYPEGTLGDPTNWWGPNPAAVVAMLKAVGFSRVELVYSSHSRSLVYNVGRAFKDKLSGTNTVSRALNQGRVVYHAWR